MLDEEAGIRWGGAAALVVCAFLGDGWARMAAIVGALGLLMLKDKTEPIWKKIFQLEKEFKHESINLKESHDRLESSQKVLTHEIELLRSELDALSHKIQPKQEPRWRLAAASVAVLLLLNGLFMTLGILHADF